MRPPFRRQPLRRAVTGIAVLALPLYLAACGGGSSTSESTDTASAASSEDTGGDALTSVTVGIIPIVDVAPLYLGVEKGFFKDAGLDVKTEKAQGGAAIVPAVVSNQYQFGFSNSVSLMLAQSKGLDLKVVSNGNSTTGVEGKDFGAVVVKDDSTIQGAKDLEGKKVAVNTLNNINTVTINESVRKAGGDPSKVTYVELPFPEIAPAVAKGDVDAGQVVEPFTTIAAQQASGRSSPTWRWTPTSWSPCTSPPGSTSRRTPRSSRRSRTR